ncbi:TraB/GumN family protein [Prosthecobacter fusiformis]|uniref:TraB/GumN family protein n=1 Tax=Prosthecobacter fusiformis TaxID=48464 RepID=UPI001414D110|nr:TraB/GumN family protein [Prosthecobacter fusiformis]
MFNIRHPLAVTCLFFLSACNQRGGERTPDTPVSAASQAGSVWVVDAPETGGRLFLCGTIHILREDDYPLSPAYEAAYANSDRVIFELPPGAGEGPSMTTRMRELGMYPEGESLEQNVTPETWKEYSQWAATRGISPGSLNRYRPWFVSLLITSTEYAALGAKPEWGVDHHFEERAKRDQKPADGLESVEFQLQLFAKLTPAQQNEMLVQTLGEVSTLPKEFDEMITSWKEGELDSLSEMLFREQAKFPDLMDLFLFNRNLAWMGRLEEMLKKGEKVMLLVGTGHFAADKGLIPLLRQRGYQVRHYRDVEQF